MSFRPWPAKRLVLLVLKAAFSLGMLAFIASRIAQQNGFSELRAQLRNLGLGWLLAALATQVVAVGCSTRRWQILLAGQGIEPGGRFLLGSFLIGRFWGAFTPGGFTGHGGWRVYDIARCTGKTARAAATIGIEMLLGQLAFGLVVMLGSVFGKRLLGTAGVVVVNLGFAAIIGTGLLLLSRPRLFRSLAGRLPAKLAARAQPLVEAACAYEGKLGLLARAVLLGTGTHVAHNFLYVCTARAVGANLPVGEVFFASSLQILATLLPASINGIGLREAAAVGLYSRVGLPTTQALLIPLLGFAVEMAVSAVGGAVFLLRRSAPAAHAGPDGGRPASLPPAASRAVAWHRGALAGLWAGGVVGLAEALAILIPTRGSWSLQAPCYGLLVYGIAGAALGAGLSVLWPSARLRALATGVFAALALPILAFRLRRDLWQEQWGWRSLQGLAVLLGCVAAVALLAGALALGMRWLSRRRPRWAAACWRHGGLAFALLGLLLGGAALLQRRVMQASEASVAKPGATHAAQPASGSLGNVLFIVVDTLRADHLPSYGYAANHTPHLQAFDADAIRFAQGFANASWTRPSFASLLTGRLPASHGVMGKNDSLPQTLTTLPEALRTRGWQTAAFVTNFNVAPYFNFQQGFDTYRYLEPNFVLGADDATAKLLLLQSAKQRLERWRAQTGRVAPGSAYQDAATVNRHVSRWLAGAPATPWMLFVAYMDPHDPYFEHPYNGRGYARAAHPQPAAGERQVLQRLYDGEIRYWDAQFGQLIAELKRRGLYDDLTIVLTSDHGEEFFEHGGYWHGTTLYDEQLHVPLWLKLPRNERGGSVIQHWVQSIDIMPTLLRLASIELPRGVQGGDLFQGSDLLYAEENHEGNVLTALRRRQASQAHKLIRANAHNPRGLPDTALFEVNLDPAETQNLAAKANQAATLGQMRAAMQQTAAEAKRGAAMTRHVNLQQDDEALERLRNLGYAGP